jgi:hypothetical protein
MELREHIFYQDLLRGQFSMADSVRTFEKVVSDAGVADLDQLRSRAVADEREESDAAPDEMAAAVDRRYSALLIQTLFGAFPDRVVRDYINLAHKETLARRVSRLLHMDDVNLHKVESVLAEFSALPVGESQVSTHIAVGIRVQLISFFISDNLFYIGAAKNHITMRDTSALIERFIGKFGQRSRVGGKSAGMILANRIVKPAFGEPTGFEEQVDEVESYYLTAQVFNRFIEHNRLEEGHGLKYLDAEEREQVREELEVRFLRGSFPDEIDVQLRELLRTLEGGPLIVRSSSMLEDSMGFPFYGKYESIFVSNVGSEKERYAELLRAIKRVYVSILSSSVIEYRKDKALLDYDDMMSVLIQRVVGQQYGRYFYPAMAGVSFSRNQYCWNRRIQPEDGVARIVYGLGTRAVDRSGDDYPRLVSLGQPELRPEGSIKEMMRYSQRFVDVLNLETRAVETVHFVDLYNYIRKEVDPAFAPAEAVSLVSDDRLTTPALYPSSLEYGGAAITFDGLLGGNTPTLMRDVLKLLEKSFGVPVDVEFAWQGGKLYILQCRPLAEFADESLRVEIPSPSGSRKSLFTVSREIFRSADIRDIRYLVYVDANAYHALDSRAAKLEVARTVGRVNRALRGSRFIIMGPGRWGSSNIELGVKVSYGDINNTRVLVEIATERGGYTPELSYGTHFFQDLLEADIVPLPIYPDDDGSLDLDFLRSAPNQLEEFVPKGAALEPGIAAAVSVIDLDAWGPGRLSIYLDASNTRGVGLLG